MPAPASQPVPTRSNQPRHPSNPVLAAPVATQTRGAASPMSYGPMAGISFTNGGGFSFENKPRSVKWGSASAQGGNGVPGSYGAKFYGDGGDSPYQPFSSSITMGEPSSFAANAMAFHLPSSAMSSSYQRRSYAAAVAGNPSHLSSSFASMSFQPMSISLGTSYSKSQVHNLMHNQSRSDAELTKAYECCNQTHEGLHALLEHVEDAHPFTDPEMPSSGFSPMTHAMELDMEGVDAAALPSLNEKEGGSNGSNRSSQSPNPVPSYPLPPSASKPTTPTEVPPAPLRISDVLASPPENDQVFTARSTLTNSTTSSPPDSLTTPTTSAQPSPVFAQPKINPARPGFLGSTAPRPAAQQKRFDRAFNEVVASTSPRNSNVPVTPTAVAPGVLFATAVAGLGIPTTPPVPGQQATDATQTNENNEATPNANVNAAATVNGTPGNAAGNAAKVAEAQMPQPSLFTTHKPWRCPNPGCNKAYKQSNGLKYHQQKGQCDFAIHDAVDLGLSIEEAEERSRPFVCAVGAGCNKRYRQMNGLKYHYLNSGEHGQYGLRMLQNGTHPHPPSLPPPTKKPTPTSSPNPNNVNHTNPNVNTNNATNANGNSNANSHAHAHPHHPATTTSSSSQFQRPVAGAPYAVPNKMAQSNANGPRPNTQGGPRMGTWPSRPPPPKQAPPVQLPSQRGRDAVLFAAVGNDPLDVNGRLEI